MLLALRIFAVTTTFPRHLSTVSLIPYQGYLLLYERVQDEFSHPWDHYQTLLGPWQARNLGAAMEARASPGVVFRFTLSLFFLKTFSCLAFLDLPRHSFEGYEGSLVQSKDSVIAKIMFQKCFSILTTLARYDTTDTANKLRGKCY